MRGCQCTSAPSVSYLLTKLTAPNPSQHSTAKQQGKTAHVGTGPAHAARHATERLTQLPLLSTPKAALPSPHTAHHSLQLMGSTVPSAHTNNSTRLVQNSRMPQCCRQEGGCTRALLLLLHNSQQERNPISNTRQQSITEPSAHQGAYLVPYHVTQTQPIQPIEFVTLHRSRHSC